MNGGVKVLLSKGHFVLNLFRIKTLLRQFTLPEKTREMDCLVKFENIFGKDIITHYLRVFRYWMPYWLPTIFEQNCNRHEYLKFVVLTLTFLASKYR